jgi:hypothetical protein
MFKFSVHLFGKNIKKQTFFYFYIFALVFVFDTKAVRIMQTNLIIQTNLKLKIFRINRINLI